MGCHNKYDENITGMEDSRSIAPFEYIDLSFWNEFQSSFSTLLGVPIAIHSYDGAVLAPPSREDSVAELIKKQSGKGLELYRDSYKKAITKAIQRAEPYVYKCYTNQYIFVIPVILDRNVSVAIIGGHIYLSEDDFKDFIERAVDFGLDEVAIHELEKGFKIISPQNFFTKPAIVKETAVPFLRSLYLKGFYEKRYYQMQSVMEITMPSFLHEGQEDLYRYVFNAMAVLFDVDTTCVLERYDKHSYRTTAAFGRKKNAVAGWMVSDSLDIIKRVVAAKKPEGCNNIVDIKKIGLPEDIVSVCIIPMAIGDNVFGLLCIFNTKISTGSMRLLTLLANQLSFVVEGRRADQNIKKKVKGLNALEEVYKTIAPVLDQEELHDAILNKAAELVDAEQGSLMLLGGEDRNLTIKATKGIERSILENIKIKIGEGISGTVAEKGIPIVVKDIESESEAFTRENRPRYRTKSFVSIPLKIGSRSVGVINISDKISGEVFSEEDLQLLLSFASYASIALECGAYYRMTEDLKKVSITDSLTELFNRRYFQERLLEEIGRSKRHNEPFTLFIIDIDDFKAFNDRYGHLAGDEVLKKVTYAIRDGIRSIDVAARFGGEEFSIILPYTTKENSYVTAERIRRSVEDIRFIGNKIPPNQSLTVSIGIAEFPSDATSIEELIDRADKAMYVAKARGKNKIVGYEQEYYS
ncbi:MAG: diguanylate cyclase [Deltaproteobacteria bacterium]|nr:diguanylate cyclase [Deltaproteobacteria bacterium]